MTTTHNSILSAEAHEPKHITDAFTTDSGKVLTPSSSTAGTSILRFLATADLSDWAGLAATFATLTGVQSLTNKRIVRRVTPLTFSTAIASNVDTTDLGTVTLTDSTGVVSAPTGTPTDGQRIAYRLKQGGTGSNTIAWNAVFRFPGATAPTLTITLNKTDRIEFEWNAASSTWDGVGSVLNL